MNIFISTCFAMSVVGIGAQTANAQQVRQDFAIERFRLSTDGLGILDVESAETLGHLVWQASMWVGYEDDPLVLKRQGSDERVGSLVNHRIGGEVLLSLGLWNRLQLGVALPVSFSQDADDLMQVQQASLSGLGVGDIRVTPKVTLLRAHGEGTSLALIPAFTVPSAGEDNYLGSEGLSFRPELALSHRRSKWRAGLNLAYQTRRKQQFANIDIEDEIRLRAGFGVLLTKSLDVNLTYSLGTLGKEPFKDGQSSSMEVLGGAGIAFSRNVRGFVAGGVGLASGYGTPDWRALVGMRIGGNKTKSKEVAVLDTDGDGIFDDKDECLRQPETVNGLDDDDGCPDEKVVVGDVDTDDDGINDADDNCPEQAEDVDTFEDSDGCPDPDNDEDGVEDLVDSCPLEKGAKANRGCPIADRDGDGVADAIDSCPDESGPAANQGCVKEQLVKIVDGKIDILDRVFFKTNKAKILIKSNRLLNNVAEVLKSHPEIDQIEVQGHTDSRGSDKANKRLSQRRAQAVVRYLVKRGVSKNRLSAAGYGEEQPIESNDTDEGRSTNRRVEFKIVGGQGIQTNESGPGKDSMDN